MGLSCTGAANPVIRSAALAGKIRYTPHATHWMRLRYITWREVETALADPEIRCPGHSGRTVIRTHVGGRLLRIVYEMRRGTCLVFPSWLR
jgi:hypothetical protein